MKLLIANLVLWGSIAAYALPPAFDKELSNTQASNINHKYDNIDSIHAYLVNDNKAYKMVDGLVSNEWTPLTADGYTDDYNQSDKAKEIKAANASLKRIKEGDL